MPTTDKSTRLWEIDALRGLAVVLMIFFHLMWDLQYFGLYQGNVLDRPWQWFARSIGSTFIFVMGASLTLSYHRAGSAVSWVKYLRRGGQIFGWGLVITVATYFFIGNEFVVFGILHLIGLSIVLAYPFLRWPQWVSLVVGLAVIGLGIYVDTLVVASPWLIWLGIRQAGRSMADYYPLLPWFAPALLGVFVGRTFYEQGRRSFVLPDLSRVAPLTGLRFLGQHSLLIYLVHQPVLIGVLMALGYGGF